MENDEKEIIEIVNNMSSEELYREYSNSQYKVKISYGEFIGALINRGEITLQKALNCLTYLPNGKEW